MKKLALTIFILTLVISGCSSQNTVQTNTTNSSTNKPENIMTRTINGQEDLAAKYTTAVITTNVGEFTLELYGDQAPITVNNFMNLAQDGFYNNVKFHRVIANFMIQAGDPNSKDDANPQTWGTGGPGYNIPDEFVEGLSNVRGTIAMANTGRPNSGGSQFFINTVDNTGLDFDKQPLTSRHPVFGKIIAGMDIIDKIDSIDVDDNDKPLDPVIIKNIELKTKN